MQLAFQLVDLLHELVVVDRTLGRRHDANLCQFMQIYAIFHKIRKGKEDELGFSGEMEADELNKKHQCVS